MTRRMLLAPETPKKKLKRTPTEPEVPCRNYKVEAKLQEAEDFIWKRTGSKFEIQCN